MNNKATHIARQCYKCNTINNYPMDSADGGLCIVCGGHTEAIGYSVVQNKKGKVRDINVTINVDTSQLDEANEKIKLLNREIQRSLILGRKSPL